jgi:hypothetical protein
MGSDKEDTVWPSNDALAILVAGPATPRRREAINKLNKFGLLSGEGRIILNFWNFQYDQIFDDPEFRNDWELQASRIEFASTITDDMRKFMMQVLRGEEKRPPHRVKTIDATLRQIHMAIFVATLEYCGYSSVKAIEMVADLYQVDGNDVRRALRKHAPRPLRKKVNEEFREELRA